MKGYDSFLRNRTEEYWPISALSRGRIDSLKMYFKGIRWSKFLHEATGSQRIETLSLVHAVSDELTNEMSALCGRLARVHKHFDFRY